MRFLIVGAGGREHALGWACRRDEPSAEILFAPGNGGTVELGENVEVAAEDAAGLARLAAERAVDLVIVGPDNALAAGVADACRAVGVTTFGPSRAAARLESSKQFAKRLMQQCGIPTAAFEVADAVDRDAALAFIAQRDGRCVVKADGLAKGKGVTVCDNAEQAQAALAECLDDHRFGESGELALVEELLTGREVSVFALCDGEHVRMLGAACDYKRALEGDRGDNTGGMGAYAPPQDLDVTQLLEDCRSRIVEPVVAEMQRRGEPFSGCLYCGIMLTEQGPVVLEFNVRFGDPETQVLLPLVAENVPQLLREAATGEFSGGGVRRHDGAAVCVVASTALYPQAGGLGEPITLGVGGVDGLLLHAGTRRRGSLLETSGGRVLNGIGVGNDLMTARERAYAELARVNFSGMRFRRDVAAETVEVGHD